MNFYKAKIVMEVEAVEEPSATTSKRGRKASKVKKVKYTHLIEADHIDMVSDFVKFIYRDSTNLWYIDNISLFKIDGLYTIDEYKDSFAQYKDTMKSVDRMFTEI
jgi:hypothetical protein